MAAFSVLTFIFTLVLVSKPKSNTHKRNSFISMDFPMGRVAYLPIQLRSQASFLKYSKLRWLFLCRNAFEAFLCVEAVNLKIHFQEFLHGLNALAIQLLFEAWHQQRIHILPPKPNNYNYLVYKSSTYIKYHAVGRTLTFPPNDRTTREGLRGHPSRAKMRRRLIRSKARPTGRRTHAARKTQCIAN